MQPCLWRVSFITAAVDAAVFFLNESSYQLTRVVKYWRTRHYMPTISTCTSTQQGRSVVFLLYSGRRCCQLRGHRTEGKTRIKIPWGKKGPFTLPAVSHHNWSILYQGKNTERNTNILVNTIITCGRRVTYRQCFVKEVHGITSIGATCSSSNLEDYWPWGDKVVNAICGQSRDLINSGP